MSESQMATMTYAGNHSNTEILLAFIRALCGCDSPHAYTLREALRKEFGDPVQPGFAPTETLRDIFKRSSGGDSKPTTTLTEEGPKLILCGSHGDILSAL